ncbi:MAG: hypothetical protein QG635_921, partial [Bacteroidota bacterium]|nr:hypothetical protein [Bacteroidota bacterium]
SFNIIPKTRIKMDLSDTTVISGSSFIFTIQTQGRDLTYQWYKKGMEIFGATDSSYSFSQLSYFDEGDYYVIVKGYCGDDTSRAAHLTVDTTTGIFDIIYGNSGIELTSADYNYNASNIELSIESVLAAPAEYYIINTLGEIALKGNIELFQGANNLTIPAGNISSGIYFIIIKSSSQNIKGIIAIIR